MGGMTFSSVTTPELRTVPKIWICVDTEQKKIVTTKDLKFEESTERTYTDDDFAEQLTAAAIEERLK